MIAVNASRANYSRTTRVLVAYRGESPASRADRLSTPGVNGRLSQSAMSLAAEKRWGGFAIPGEAGGAGP